MLAVLGTTLRQHISVHTVTAITMQSFRCLRTGLFIFRQTTTATPAQSARSALLPSHDPPTHLTPPPRSLSILSRLPTRPVLLTSTPTSAIATDTPSSSLQLPTQPSGLLEQVRGAKRDTFNPSHIVRKRRHGFLSRLRTRNGRAVLKRRRLKGRNTLSH